MTEVLSACATCEQKVAPRIAGRATTPAHVSQPQQPAVGGASESSGQHNALIRERDELLEQKRQQERTMGSLMEQLAIAKSQSANGAAAPADDPMRRELQLQVRELRSRVSQLEDEAQKVGAERDMANTAAQAWEDKHTEMQSRAAEFAAKAAELETRLATTATIAVRPEHKATSGNSALAAELAELQKANESLTRERDEALASLEQFRSTALQALTPLGIDCSDSIKRLITETEATVEHLREQYEQASRTLDQQLKQSGDKLKDQMKQCRRELVERFSEVLGTSSEISAMPAGNEEKDASSSRAEHAA